MKIRAFNIRYDTDGYKIDLPEELFFEVEDHESVEDEVCDGISDRTGFCHFGFDYEVLD